MSVYGIMDVQTYSPAAFESPVSPTRLTAVTPSPPASPTRPEPGSPAADLLERLNTTQDALQEGTEAREDGGAMPTDEDDESFLYPSRNDDDHDEDGQRTARSASPASPLSSVQIASSAETSAGESASSQASSQRYYSKWAPEGYQYSEGPAESTPVKKASSPKPETTLGSTGGSDAGDIKAGVAIAQAPRTVTVDADAILARLASFDKPAARRTSLATAHSPLSLQPQQLGPTQPITRVPHPGEHRKGPEMLPGIQPPQPSAALQPFSASSAVAESPDRDLKHGSADSSIESLLPSSFQSRFSIQTAVNDSLLANVQKDLELERGQVKRLEANLQEERQARRTIEEEHDRLKKVAIGLRARVDEANQVRPALETAERERGQLAHELAMAKEQLEQSTTTLRQAQQKLHRVEEEYGDAVREIIRLEECAKEKVDVQDVTISSGNELIELRLRYVDAERDCRRAILELEQVEEEKNALLGRFAQAEQTQEKLKTAMVRYRHERDLELQQKDREIDQLRAELEEEREHPQQSLRAVPAPSPMAETDATTSAAVITRLLKVVELSNTATARLRRHLKAVMLRADSLPSEVNSGVLSRLALLQLAEQADGIFAERAQIILPVPMNASIEQREDRGAGLSPPIKPLHEQLNKARFPSVLLFDEEERAHAMAALQLRSLNALLCTQIEQLNPENAALRKQNAEMHEAVRAAEQFIRQSLGTA